MGEIRAWKLRWKQKEGVRRFEVNIGGFDGD